MHEDVDIVDDGDGDDDFVVQQQLPRQPQQHDVKGMPWWKRSGALYSKACCTSSGVPCVPHR